MPRIKPFLGATCLLTSVFVLLLSCAARDDEVRSRYQRSVQVRAATTIDSIYPVANQSPPNPPAGWLEGYDSTEQRYELFLPPGYDSRKAWPVVIFVSPSNQPMGFDSFRATCSKLGVIFASPYDAGNNCPNPRRARIVLDVLDDVRRQYNTDVDRTYIGGFSGGGRMACNIAFALPEYFGGVIPVCAAGELRSESWLRRRCADRLSVALVTGDGDFNRGEVERFRGPMLKDVGVRTRVWVKRGMGHSVPDGATMTEVFKWLDAAAAERTKLAQKSPTTSASPRETLDRAEQAQKLFAEAEKMLRDKDATYDALMLMKGISVRWPDLPQAKKATQVLLKYDADPAGTWREDDVAEQRLFLVARARGLDRYATGPLAKQYESQRSSFRRAAIQLWQQVINDGQDADALREAKERLQKLKEER